MANTAKKEADGSSICILMTLISAKIGGVAFEIDNKIRLLPAVIEY